MFTVRLLVLALAGSGTCLGPRYVAFSHDIEAYTITYSTIGHTATSTASSASTTPTGISIPKPDDSARAFIVGALVNERAADKAVKCKGLDQGSFVYKTVRFLSDWKPDGGVPIIQETKTTTAKQMLERLVQYQDVYRITISDSSGARYSGKEAVDAKFPANIVGEIREMKSVIDDRGILRGSNDRVLDALDVIFDDVCADTGKTSRIPRTVQETVDVVLRGISSQSC
ncbi:hypothetical protein PG988_015987 [Apiospora saccharicola]